MPSSTSPIRSFGPGQVAEDPDLLAGALGRLAGHRHVLGVVVAGAVGEVEPEDVGARLDQLDHALDAAGRGADRGHDLRSSLRVHGRGILSVGATVVGASLGSSASAGAGGADRRAWRGLGGPRRLGRDRVELAGARRVRRLGAVVGGERLALGELEPLHVGELPGGAGDPEPGGDAEQGDEPLAAGEHREVEELAHRVDRDDPGEQRPEPGDQGEHVALHGDVLASRARARAGR